MNKIAVDLSLDLRKKYGLRSFPIVKGDVVRIMKGSRKGEGGKVMDVDHTRSRITVEGITIAKADNKQKEFTLQPDYVEITRLDLSRNERVEKIRKLAALKKIVIDENDLKQEPEVPETKEESLPDLSQEETLPEITGEKPQEPEAEGEAENPEEETKAEEEDHDNEN
ncbi:MAG: 50S ribosomal protein L24 [Thermoplasmataceae archaeon]|jgi:large subunit ribosomal protein L24|nr:50S ribosomal protein L24 [Candidatus Thermoplasmatota archaeon]